MNVINVHGEKVKITPETLYFGEFQRGPGQHFYQYGEALLQTFLECVIFNGFASRCSILPAVHH
jgi:hypothetical protein